MAGWTVCSCEAGKPPINAAPVIWEVVEQRPVLAWYRLVSRSGTRFAAARFRYARVQAGMVSSGDSPCAEPDARRVMETFDEPPVAGGRPRSLDRMRCRPI